jgi:hypothetical protein
MLCIDCKTAEAARSSQRCRSCGDARNKLMVAESNKRYRELQKVKMKETPHLCQQYGCENLKEPGYLKCRGCREKQNGRQVKYREQFKVNIENTSKEYEQIEQLTPWTPRPKPKPQLTAAEHDRIIREGERKLQQDRQRINDELLFRWRTRGAMI